MAQSPLSRARARTRAYRHWRRAKGGGRTPFVQPIASSPVDPGPESEFVYWYPGRFGAELAPPAIIQKVHAIHPTLSVCRPPAKAPVPRNRWLVWASDPKASNLFCPGWYLVFVWEVTSTHQPLALEPFAHLEDCIYAVMATTTGGVRAYFQQMRAARAAAKAAKEDDYQANRRDKQQDLLQSYRISNISPGSQFALHHDGSIVPSQGELNWLRERQERRMPADVRQRLARDREQLRQAGWIP